ncbi:hypothetical protein OUZ56_002223 [Daphnia magna]|uniref:Uncharacterized protein n=1 Tax=Daphnia magna TaxID=35525 RepID=A0ABR0A5H4_9CRUS|nr:hypothetical protein OUZ56_002223 [Daphnia magna]
MTRKSMEVRLVQNSGPSFSEPPGQGCDSSCNTIEAPCGCLLILFTRGKYLWLLVRLKGLTTFKH